MLGAAPAADPIAKIREARILGFTGDSCGECGSMKMVRNGTCVKCVDCGSTTGCS
jgi:ribonucleoside-diphosphate reductase alpha chain